MYDSENEYESLFSDFEVSETSSVSSCSESDYEELVATEKSDYEELVAKGKSDYEELVAKEMQKISVFEQALLSFNRIVRATQNELALLPDEPDLFGAYVASECRSIKDQAVLFLLQKRIKDVIFETKKSYLECKRQVNTTGENNVDRVQAVSKKYKNFIATHLQDNYETDDSNINEDKENSLMTNTSNNKEDTTKVFNGGISNEGAVNSETSEIHIQLEIIDSDFDVWEDGITADNGQLSSNSRLSEDKELNVYDNNNQNTVEKDIICPPDFVVDRSFKVKSCNGYDINKPRVKKETTKVYKCCDCTKTFLIDTEFFVHLELHETGVIKRGFDCAKCGKCFSNKGVYNKHLRVHTGIKNLMCEICGKCFSTTANLQSHMLIHTNIRKHKCTICKKSFAQRQHLIIHLRGHRNDKKYECAICTRRFIAKGSLQNHMVVHLNDKKHCCQQCGKYFKYKSAFKMHLLWHSGIKEYICDVCNKEYYNQGKLNLHMKTHKVGMFVCLECGRNFTLKNFLQRHMVKHIGERNFMCDLCGKCFLRERNLKQHIKSKSHNS